MKIKTLKDLEALLRLIESDNGPDAKIGFDMENPAPHASNHPCGMACCIGGWVNHINYPDANDRKSFASAVVELKGVKNRDDAIAICFPLTAGGMSHKQAYKATPAQARRLIKNYRKTGKVDWQWAMTTPA